MLLLDKRFGRYIKSKKKKYLKSKKIHKKQKKYLKSKPQRMERGAANRAARIR